MRLSKQSPPDAPSRRASNWRTPRSLHAVQARGSCRDGIWAGSLALGDKGLEPGQGQVGSAYKLPDGKTRVKDKAERIVVEKSRCFV